MGQTWSIGIEESFYLIYPLMLLLLNRKALVITLVAVAFLPEISALLAGPVYGDCQSMGRFSNYTVFYSTIAVGCLTYLTCSAGNAEVNRLLFSRTTRRATFAAVVIVTIFAIAMKKSNYFDWRIVALTFSLLVLNAGFNANSILRGMYMYHVFCIVLALLICWIFFRGETFPFQHLIVDTLSLSFTIIISKLSYDWIETPIRALRRKGGLAASTISPSRFARRGDPRLVASAGKKLRLDSWLRPRQLTAPSRPRKMERGFSWGKCHPGCGSCLLDYVALPASGKTAQGPCQARPPQGSAGANRRALGITWPAVICDGDCTGPASP